MATEIDLTPAPEPDRDRWGRYLLPDPNGKVVPHTRATTICDQLDRKENLTEWRLRNVARGLGMKPNLVALAQSHHEPHDGDKRTFTDIIEKAEEAAGAGTKADLGTALHKYIERVELGHMTVDEISEPLRSRVEQYLRAVKGLGLELVAEATEQIYIDDHQQVAGTGDRAYRANGYPLPLIADVKTGRIDYGQLKIPAQLAIYQAHTATFDTRTKKRGPALELERDIGLVIHLPSEGTTCEIWEVDLALGRTGYDLGVKLHAFRKVRFDDAFTPFRPRTGLGPYEQLYQRLWALAAIPGAEGFLRASWPPSVPQPLPVNPSVDEYQAMDQFLAQVEGAFGAPFYPPVMNTTEVKS